MTMKAHLIFELTPLARTFWEITARVFISSGTSNLLHILATNVQFYLNLFSS